MRMQLRIAVLIAASTLLATGCGKFFRDNTGSGGTTTTEFIYVANANNGGQGSVSSFSVNTTSGALTAITNGAGAGLDTSVLATDPQNRFVFAGNNAGGISAFTTSSGTLAAVSGSPFAPGTTPVAMAVRPGGANLYVLDDANFTISAFTIASNGSLTATAGSASNNITDTGDSMVINSAGTRLFAAVGTAGIAVVPINTDGSLGAAAITPAPSGQKITAVSLTPGGNFLYATNGATGVFGYSVNTSTGALSILNNGNPFAAGTQTAELAMDPNGRFLLVVNTQSNNVTSFAILSDGSLTQVSGSPFTTGTGPADITFDANGKFVYVVNSQGTPGISIFSLDASTIGKLNSAGSANAGTNPLGIASSH